MNRRRVAVLLVVISALALLAGSAAADSATKRVGLVIALGNGNNFLQAVTVPAAATTFDVLQAANITLATETTAYGPAVCSINSVGCPATNCFCDSKHFWAYYHLNATNASWSSASEGVGTYVPADGAVEGFAWSGLDVNFNPTDQPPVVTFAQIIAQTTPVAIPEPATVLLLGTGIGGLLAYLRLRRSR